MNLISISCHFFITHIDLRRRRKKSNMDYVEMIIQVGKTENIRTTPSDDQTASLISFTANGILLLLLFLLQSLADLGHICSKLMSKLTHKLILIFI